MMERRHPLYVSAAVLVLLPLLGVLGSIVWAQAIGGQGGAALPSEAWPLAAEWLDADLKEFFLSEGLLLVLGVLECWLLVAGMEAFDSWRERRAGEVTWLRGRIANALQRNRVLKNLAVTPVVRLPLLGRFGATVELRGQVPTGRLRHAVMRTAELEAARSMAVSHVDDRLVIAPSREAQAA